MPRKTTRNAQGGGTIRKRPDGRWEARFTIGRDPGTGRQVQRSIYGDTQADVRKRLQQATAAIEEGTYMEPSKMTMGQWLDIWLKEYTGGIKEHTAVTYETQVRVHIKPAIGAVPLASLKAHQIQAFYNRLQKGEGGEGLSPKTIKNIHGVLHRAIDQAVVLGYLRQNPCLGVRLPRIEKAQIMPFDDDQITVFLDAIKGNEYEALFTVDIFTGMRQSEIMGLQWSCIDFDGGTIYIDKQLVREKKKGGTFKFAPPKNDKPRRITPAPSVMKLLKERRKKQMEDRLAAGELWANELDLVFTDKLGCHYIHNTISHNFKRIATAMGLPDMRFHDLRHSYAVSSLRAGDDVKTVQENLGHHTAAFTLDQYGHVTASMRNESAARMEAFINRLSKGS